MFELTLKELAKSTMIKKIKNRNSTQIMKWDNMHPICQKCALKIFLMHIIICTQFAKSVGLYYIYRSLGWVFTLTKRIIFIFSKNEFA
jgi:hypothetical protein